MRRSAASAEKWEKAAPKDRERTQRSEKEEADAPRSEEAEKTAPKS